ncbi:hypothetical protein [Actinospongicola halichondriae]|uniref:hypothetical protein n=1 Tax=Actinospongicola halichondriae TaxID=3236844 RepID=UPI003D59CB6B
MVVTIMVIVGIIGIGVGILAYRSRTEKGIESGISSFRRELHALARARTSSIVPRALSEGRIRPVA